MPQVMVVDDDQLVRFIIAKILRYAGHRAAEAKNGVEALHLLDETSQFDVIISDTNMPEMDGIRLLGELKQHYPAIPVIMLSFDNQSAQVKLLLEKRATTCGA